MTDTASPAELQRLPDDETGLPPHILHPEPLLIVLSGPSGVGKDAVLSRVKELGYPFHFVVTATTRPQRPSEVHGVDYFFVSEEEFRRMLDEGELLEHALVYGHHKGIPREQIRQALASGKDAIMRIDVQGAATIKRLIPQALFIFLAAPTMKELIERLIRRKTDTGADFQKRIKTARREMMALSMFDYVVINRNDRLDEAVEQIRAIIQAEKCRVRPRKIEL